MLNIIIPMGGEGKRFIESGYTFPKPLIEIDGHPMIELVVQNLRPTESHRFTFVCRRDHADQYALQDVLEQVSPGCRTVVMNGSTGGALCSVLLGMDHHMLDEPLLVANADQIIDFQVDDFLTAARKRSADGSIVTFPSTHPKWSYVKLEDDAVVAAAEKRPSAHMQPPVFITSNQRETLLLPLRSCSARTRFQIQSFTFALFTTSMSCRESWSPSSL